MAKYKIIGIDEHNHTQKVIYVDAEDKAKAINQAYHIPLYLPIKAVEIDNE